MKTPTAARTVKRASAAPFYGDYLPYLVARAAFLILGDFHALLKRFRMPVLEWRVLASLSGGHGYTIGALARITLCKQPTLSRLIDRLEARGLARREEAPEDRRQSVVVITARGKKRIAPVLATARRHERRVLQGFRAKDVAALKRLLRAFTVSFEARQGR
jgi:DNA-binding MarR family transcriptional regulator